VKVDIAKVISTLISSFMKSLQIKTPVMRGFTGVREFILALLFLIGTSGVLMAQRSVSGTVADINNSPLPGVSVTVKGTSSGTMTDVDGKYTLQLPANAKTLVFTFVGMESQEVTIGQSSTYNVTLSESTIGLDEVVVVGYGKQSREVLTTSVSKLDTKVLANVQYANVGSALQGSLAGVRVQTITGMPGSAPRIIIRGGTSINNPDGAAPLYIVDGVIRSHINNIDQNDIESMQVLKDAAATAIYGARASNGVVILTTRTGQAGRTQIDYKYDFTVSNNTEKYDLLNARDYIYFQRQGIYRSSLWGNKPAQMNILSQPSSSGTGNDLTNNTAYTVMYLSPANQHKLNEGWQSMPDPLDSTRTIIFNDFDFQNILFRTGLSHNHNITASGGTDRATFSTAIGYMNTDGIVITTNYKRLTSHLNGMVKLTDNISFNGRVMYANSRDNNPTGASTFGRSIGLPPTAKYRFEDGTLAPGQNQSLGNNEYHLNTQVRKNSIDDFTMSVGASMRILPGLSFDPQFSWWQTTTDFRFFQRAFWNGPTSYVVTRNSSGSHDKYVQRQADAVLTYVKSFMNVHNLETKLGFSYFNGLTTRLSATGRDAATDLISTLNAAATPVSVSGDESENMIFGYFGRLNYDYMQKYLLSVNARFDGASNLGENYKWGFFPGISVGWNLHKEPFWAVFPENLLRLKLRASYGVNGNISGLGPYTAQGTYAVGSRYGGVAVVQNTVMVNNELQWEQSRTLDFGLDLGLFNTRINIMFDWYRRVTDNLLASMALPFSTGFASTLTNNGSLENKGVEMELMASILPPGSKFQWESSLNFSTVHNKILRLPPNGVERNRQGGVEVWDPELQDYVYRGGLQEGGTMGEYWTYQFLGVYATDEEAANAPVDDLTPIADKTFRGGDVILGDIDGNGRIDTRDKVYAGNIYPTFMGGFSNWFTWNNFTLAVRTDFTVGQTIFNYTRGTLIGQFQGDNGLGKELLRSWQKPGDVTDIPIFVYADQQVKNRMYRNAEGNTFFYERGDFLALREITLSYDLPRNLLQRVKIQALRVNVTGNNLHYFTKFTGLNPEFGGTDSGRFPIPRNIIFGVNLTL
jgi:TonB-linked SusC/RagA family outer membrane protein